MENSYLFEIALCMAEGIGPLTAKHLIATFGSAENVFQASESDLIAECRGGTDVQQFLEKDKLLSRAEAELRFAKKNELRIHFFDHENYPEKLKACDDAPVLLFSRGEPHCSANKVISIVGTRRSSSYGAEVVRDMVAGLQKIKPVVVSGLALGIDTVAHQAAVLNELETWAVVGHSLDRIYPAENRELAREIIKSGAIFSEFFSGTKPDRENFPQRNRLVAGMADVLIVVETGVKGGSMITAELAGGYCRDVYAVPNSLYHRYSEGCHFLIRTNKAAIFTTVADLLTDLGWKRAERKSSVQASLPMDLEGTELGIYRLLEREGNSAIDKMSLQLGIPTSKLSSALLLMELKGLVRTLPGNLYGI